MNKERYDFLMKSFEMGYRVDIEKLEVFNHKGKKITISFGIKDISVLMKGRKFSMVEVVGAWTGMDVVDKCCFVLDGNKKNYSPENLSWISRGELMKKLMKMLPRKFSDEDILAIRNFDYKTSKLSTKDLAKKYGVTVNTIHKIRNKSGIFYKTKVDEALKLEVESVKEKDLVQDFNKRINCFLSKIRNKGE